MLKLTKKSANLQKAKRRAFILPENPDINSKPTEVLKFKNPLHTSTSSSKQNPISMHEAKSCIFNLFRSKLPKDSEFLTEDQKSKISSLIKSSIESDSNFLGFSSNSFEKPDCAFMKFMLIRNQIHENSPRSTDKSGLKLKFSHKRGKSFDQKSKNDLKPGENSNDNIFLDHYLKWVRNYSSFSIENIGKSLSSKKTLLNVPLLVQDSLRFIEVYMEMNSIDLPEYLLNLILLMAVLIKIEEFGCECKIEESVDGSEIFVFVYADEKTSLQLSNLMKYRLKLKNKDHLSYRFQKYSSYTQLPPSYLENLSNLKSLFSTYNEQNQEAPDGSYFTFTDKYRLVNRMINETMSISLLSQKKLLTTRFVLHEPQLLQELIPTFKDFILLKSIPMTKIKLYFSEHISFYFSFLKFLQRFSIFFTFVGFLVYLIRLLHHYGELNDSNMLIVYLMYSSFLVFWSFWVMKEWGRREKYLAWKWGTLDFADQEVPRSHFKGRYKIDEVTGRYKILESDPIRCKFFRVLNILITISLILFNLLPLLVIDKLKDFLITKFQFSAFNSEMIVGSLTSIQINTFDYIFRLIARKITMWENYETYQQHNDSLIIKLFAFKFVNSYLNLFYIAFFKDKEGGCENGSCIKELSYRLFTIFTTGIVLNILEILLPLLKNFYNSREGFLLSKIRFNDPSKSFVCDVEKQLTFDEYDYAVKDYLELITRIGYLILFGTTHQLFGIVVVVGIYIESRIDIYKLCRLYRRPEPVKTESIGVWKKIFMFVAICGVFTNLGINIFSSGLLKNYTKKEKFLLFIYFEHFLMFIIVVFWNIFPDVPTTVFKAKLWGKRFADEKLGYHIGINENKIFQRNKIDNNERISSEFDVISKLK